MTRILSSALRPMRLHGAQPTLLPASVTVAAKVQQQQSQYLRPASRAVATYNGPSTTTSTQRKPAAQPQSSYKRSATTATNSSPSSPSSSSSSTASRPTTSAYAENQVNPVTAAPYTPPPNMGAIPEASSSSGSDSKFANNGIDWSSSFHGLSTTPFDPDVAAVLMKAIPYEDVEIKPDGIIYLPEIKYRRILNQAFGPGGWGMAPRGELAVGEKVVTREYALLVHGRFIAQARGECQFFGNDDGIATAGEGCKSNALMRCCKDLGIASELWDPRYIRDFKKKYSQEIWVEHVVLKKKRQIWVRKGDDPQYPYKKC